MAAVSSSRALQKLTRINAACLVLLWILEALIAERTWVTTLVTYIPQHLFVLPAVLFLVLAIVRRDRRLTAVNALAVVFWAFALMGLNIPLRAMIRRPARPSVRVMTYNIHHGLGGMDKIAADVRSISPDVACFEEVNPLAKKRSPFMRLTRDFPRWQSATFGDLAVFSKWPIVGYKIHGPSAGRRRALLQVGLLVHGRRFDVICMHVSTASTPESISKHKGSLASYLHRSTSARSSGISDLLRVTRSIKGPLVVAGDFNTPPRGVLYRRITNRFGDSFRNAGWGFGHSFRSDLPVMRIDYIWTGKGVRALTCGSRGLAGSDHRPVVAELYLEEVR